MDKLFPSFDWSKSYETIGDMEGDLISKDGNRSFVFHGTGWYSSLSDFMLVTNSPYGRGFNVYVWNWNGADPREDMRAILSLPFHKDF